MDWGGWVLVVHWINAPHCGPQHALGTLNPHIYYLCRNHCYYSNCRETVSDPFNWYHYAIDHLPKICDDENEHSFYALAMHSWFVHRQES